MTVCPITSDIVDAPLFRLTVPPGSRTGLDVASQVMIDKIVRVPSGAVIAEIGACDAWELEAADESLRRWLELG